MHRRERLMSLVQRGDADGFAKELDLDPDRTRQWFEQGCTQAGYGAEVIRTLGAHMLKVLTRTRDKGNAHD
jgi:hypothetical protein